MNYKDMFTKLNIISDETHGAVRLGLIERFEADRKTKISNNFVSQVETLDARILKKVIEILNSKLPPIQGGEKILGLATSGIPMATALALQRGSKFNFSSSGKFGDFNSAFSYTEAHRDEKLHYFYGIQSGDKVIIAEDEVSSGLGLLHLIKALQAYNINILAVCTVIEVVNFNAREMLEEKTGIELISLIKVKLS